VLVTKIDAMPARVIENAKAEKGPATADRATERIAFHAKAVRMLRAIAA
jgi:hypothetical protein